MEPLRYRTSKNYKEFNEQNGIVTGEVNTEESMTIPGADTTLQDLVERQRRGQYVPILDQQYNEDVKYFDATFPDLNKMSKLELVQFAHEQKDYFIKNRQALGRYVAEKRQAQQEGNPEAPTENGNQA